MSEEIWELPFGDESEECHLEGQKKCTSFRRKKGYEKLCEGCKTVTPKAMKDFITDDVNVYDDEVFYCYWCKFIRITEIDDLLISEVKKEASKEEVKKYSEEDGSDAMWELENAGAFADEGIMPGCHSGEWECMCEAEEIMQEFRDMFFVGQCIKLAREKIGISVKELANRLEMPESFIYNIENGEYIIKRTANESLSTISPIQVVKLAENNEYDQTKREKVWWQECSDESIIEKVANYLCDLFSPNTTKRCDKKVKPEMTDFDDELPF